MFKKFLSKDVYIESQYSLGEFTFGFELEAWFDPERTDVQLINWAQGYWKQAKMKFPDKLHGRPEISGDSTIEPSLSSDDEVPCEECDGTGEVRCDTCFGDGTRFCRECKGSGKVSAECPDCDGTGKIEDENGIKVECPTCKGYGYIKEDCDACDGTGEVECYRCDGTGMMNCPECYGNGYQEVDLDHNTYEFKSPVLKFMPINLQNLIKFLEEGLQDGYINTNESCGFHIHIGFPNEEKRSEDIFWVLCQLVMTKNDYMFEEILNFKDIQLWDDTYATTEDLMQLQDAFKQALSQLRRLKDSKKQEKELFGESFINESKKTEELYKDEVEVWKRAFENVSNLYDENKYTLIRQHPQGTMEWRGSRGFMDEGVLSNIKEFVLQKLYPFVKWMNSALNEKYLVLSDTVKLDREVFDRLLKDTPSPAPSMKKINKVDNRFSKNQNNNDIDRLFSDVRNKKLFKNINIKNLKFYLNDKDVQIVGGIMEMNKQRMPSHMSVDGVTIIKEGVLDSPMKFASINHSYLGSNAKSYDCDINNCMLRGTSVDESYLYSCVASNVNITNCYLDKGIVIKNSHISDSQITFFLDEPFSVFSKNEDKETIEKTEIIKNTITNSSVRIKGYDGLDQLYKLKHNELDNVKVYYDVDTETKVHIFNSNNFEKQYENFYKSIFANVFQISVDKIPTKKASETIIQYRERLEQILKDQRNK